MMQKPTALVALITLNQVNNFLDFDFLKLFLASILEEPEQAYAYALTEGAETWIGLEWNTQEGAYQWSDNWPVWYTQWGQGFPKDEQSDQCISLMENKDVQQAEWVQSSCTEKKVHFEIKLNK